MNLYLFQVPEMDALNLQMKNRNRKSSTFNDNKAIQGTIHTIPEVDLLCCYLLGNMFQIMSVLHSVPPTCIFRDVLGSKFYLFADPPKIPNTQSSCTVMSVCGNSDNNPAPHSIHGPYSQSWKISMAWNRSLFVIWSAIQKWKLLAAPHKDHMHHF